jgi:formylglycine-generating enzyme required for sulfatase activity
MPKTFTLIFVLLCSLFFFSFNQKIDRKTQKALNANYTFVPSGKLDLNGESKTIQSFIMFQGEVSNQDYSEFLSYLKTNGELEKLKIAQVDTTLWNMGSGYNKPFQDHYNSHPAYRNYPVVNITKEAAELYCAWLTEQFLPNKLGNSKLIFRLPTHDEWMYAANGGQTNPVYAWGGPYLRNEKGCHLANYVQFGSENIARDSSGQLVVETKVSVASRSNDGADVTAPVKSYWPNAFGLYNMNGNVAEIIGDKYLVAGGSWRDTGFDVRNQSSKPYSGPAPNIGFRVVATAKASDISWLKVKYTISENLLILFTHLKPVTYVDRSNYWSSCGRYLHAVHQKEKGRIISY